MDFEKMKQWMELAQQMYGGDFWKQVFDEDQKTPFMTNGNLRFRLRSKISEGKEMLHFRAWIL